MVRCASTAQARFFCAPQLVHAPDPACVWPSLCEPLCTPHWLQDRRLPSVSSTAVSMLLSGVVGSGGEVCSLVPAQLRSRVCAASKSALESFPLCICVYLVVPIVCARFRLLLVRRIDLVGSLVAFPLVSWISTLYVDLFPGRPFFVHPSPFHPPSLPLLRSCSPRMDIHAVLPPGPPRVLLPGRLGDLSTRPGRSPPLPHTRPPWTWHTPPEKPGGGRRGRGPGLREIT
eukprot:scaffold2846_cov322-Pavlova_lutheri.AAC.13